MNGWINMTALAFSGPKQLYYQLYSQLFQSIYSGQYKIGDILPTENSLAENLHVSRTTVRNAMEMLVQEGMVKRQRGKGSIVISNTPKSALSHVVSYVKKNDIDEGNIYNKVLILHIDKGLLDINHDLHLDKKAEIIHMERIHYVNEEPCYLVVNYFEKAYVPDIMDHDFSKESLRAFLKLHYGILWECATQEIYCVLADDEKANQFKIKKNSPLMLVKRISYDKNNLPREVVYTYYRADLYHLEIKLSNERI